ncbi:MAG: MIP/aquaporin family protein, partial [Planctomycetia bacterium]
MRTALRKNATAFAAEAFGTFLLLVVIGLFATLLNAPAFGAADRLSPLTRRLAMAAVMGPTVLLLVYSPWGRRSGAHVNPAVTLTFWRLGKVAPWDAAFYVAAQMLGGLAGVFAVAAALGDDFTAPPLQWVVTLPGDAGPTVAFAAEAAVSFGLMSLILWATNGPWAPKTGFLVAALVMGYVVLEMPLSGFSMNPGRSLVSNIAAGVWDFWWLYVAAPTLGMLAAAEVSLWIGRRPVCAKLCHPERD